MQVYMCSYTLGLEWPLALVYLLKLYVTCFVVIDIIV